MEQGPLDKLQVITDRLVEIEAKMREYPQPLENLLMKMLTFKRDERPDAQ